MDFLTDDQDRRLEAAMQDLARRKSINREGEHERYPLSMWREAVAADTTRRGYWTWVRQRLIDTITHQ